LALALSCGGDDMQMCGADHCGLKGHTIVKWTFDAYPQWQFPMDSCVDFGVGKVRVDAVDSTGSAATLYDDCGVGQVTFDGLPEGDYTVYVAPQDFGGGDLVSTAPSGTITAGVFGADTTVTVNVPWAAWSGGPYDGTFLFRLSWGGVTCSAAAPLVVSELVTLTVSGIPVTVTTDHGTHLDGSVPAPCYELTENFPESAAHVPFGPANLTIEGLDGSGATVFHHEFDTFVGAGITNPTITYDVPPPDAM
jgi:hypothetical protein